MPNSRSVGLVGRGVDVPGRVLTLRDLRTERRVDFAVVRGVVGRRERTVVDLWCLKRRVRCWGVGRVVRSWVAMFGLERLRWLGLKL